MTDDAAFRPADLPAHRSAPARGRRAAALRLQIDANLRAAFAPVLDEPCPPGLLALIGRLAGAADRGGADAGRSGADPQAATRGAIRAVSCDGGQGGERGAGSR